MACQWEDEQTGGHRPDLVQHFTGTKLKWFTFTNGAHVDALDPYAYDSGNTGSGGLWGNASQWQWNLQQCPAGSAVSYVSAPVATNTTGHLYRAGSRIRVTIAAPIGTQPIWSFDQTEPAGTTAAESLASSPSMPPSLVLPVVPSASAPPGLPPGPSLRNDPCRPLAG
jgi:hypothetical protein